MSRARLVVAVLISFSFAALAFGQQPAPSSTATCNLDDGRQVYIRYNPATTKTDHPANGKPWTPGGVPMTLFTEAQLNFGGSTIPVGAYSVYPIPGKDKWTLVVNKNVAANSAYDGKQDIARGAVETDQIGEPSNTLEVAFAHTGDKCTLRIYFGKAASFALFTAK
jgi:hypothetical protein